MKLAAALVAILIAAGPALCEPPAPTAPAKADKAKVYDESADARVQIDRAVAKAKKENRRVLIQWGANWCHWCVLLDGKCKTDKRIAKELLYEYDLVKVDVGRFDKHMELADKYGAKLKDSGIPYLTVLDGDGKPLANQETGELETGGEPAGHDTGKVMAFLEKHEAPPVKAADALAAGLSEASKSGRSVFLHFGAPWCGWCHKLEDWMARPEVAALLAKDFVDVKIDQDRMPGAGEVLKQYNPLSGKPGGGGIPWIVFIGADGKAVVDSNAPGSGNVGFPAKPDEIDHFMSMLEKVRKNLTEADLGAIRTGLEAESSAAGR